MDACGADSTLHTRTYAGGMLLSTVLRMSSGTLAQGEGVPFALPAGTTSSTFGLATSQPRSVQSAGMELCLGVLVLVHEQLPETDSCLLIPVS